MIATFKRKLNIYKSDLKVKGLKRSIIDRIVKYKLTRKVYGLLTPGKIVVHDSIMYLDKDDTIISHNLLLDKTWERNSTKTILKNLNPGDTFVDVGAHIGYYSLLASRIVGSEGKVYSIEPDSKNYSLLKKNIKANNYKNIQVIKKAISNKLGRINFYTNDSNTGDNRIFDNGMKRIVTKVQSTTIDEIMNNKKIDFIKMDIQGSELKALLGMKKTLKRNKKIKLLIEFWPDGLSQNDGSFEKLLSLLDKYSFELFFVDDRKTTSPKTSTKEITKLVNSKKLYDTNLLCIRN